MNTQLDKYQINRNHDCHIEEICASFADKYYLDKWVLEHPQLSYERITDLSSQFRGEDLVLKKDGNVIAYVDEKTKTYKCLNSVLGWPSFELTSLSRKLNTRFVGWFANPQNTTTHYAFINIASSKNVEPGHEWELDESDISRMVYAFINVKKLKYWVQNETGRTIEQLVNDADDLVAEYEHSPCPEALRKYYNGYIHLTYSPRKHEKPVNLVIRRDKLRLYGIITEIYIDRESFKQYDAPLGVVNPEKLYRQE